MPLIKLTDTQKRKKAQGICITPFCTKKAAGGKAGAAKCHSCIREQKKQSNPLKFAYDQWRANCRRRKKVNTVTLEEFRSFVADTNYLRKTGRGAKKFTISRKSECVDGCPREWCQAHGYHFHNIESITLRENIYKYRRPKKFADVPF